MAKIDRIRPTESENAEKHIAPAQWWMLLGQVVEEAGEAPPADRDEWQLVWQAAIDGLIHIDVDTLVQKVRDSSDRTIPRSRVLELLNFLSSKDILVPCAHDRSRDCFEINPSAPTVQRLISEGLLDHSAGVASDPLATAPIEDSSRITAMRYAIARRAFTSDAEMADVLGVHRSQITRWKQGAQPDAENGARLLALEVAVSMLEGFLESETIPKWLRGVNAHLGERRPVDVLMTGQLSEVVRAIEVEKSGSFA